MNAESADICHRSAAQCGKQRKANSINRPLEAEYLASIED